MGLRTPQNPQAPKAPLPEFQAQRKKVEQRINADTQGQQEAMQRRFAAQGMLNSGAAIKQAGLVANQAQQNREDAIGQVDAAEMGEMQRRQEVQDQRDFISNESKLGRDFQGQESAMARALQSGQFDKTFGLQERDFTRQGEQWKQSFDQGASQFDRNFAQQASQFDRNFAQQGQQFNDQMGLQKSQQGFDRQDQAHNLGVSISQMDDKDYELYRVFMQGKGVNLPPRGKGQNMSSNSWNAQPYVDDRHGGQYGVKK